MPIFVLKLVLYGRKGVKNALSTWCLSFLLHLFCIKEFCENGEVRNVFQKRKTTLQ